MPTAIARKIHRNQHGVHMPLRKKREAKPLADKAVTDFSTFSTGPTTTVRVPQNNGNGRKREALVCGIFAEIAIAEGTKKLLAGYGIESRIESSPLGFILVVP